MATKPSTVATIVEQASEAGPVTARKMFGEYGLYCREKLVALVCDDRLFVKPTEAGRARAARAGPVTEAPPYPGAKPYLLIPGEAWEDAGELAELFRVTAAALPMPPPKKAGAARRPRPAQAGARKAP